jgi:hypothetical protein
MNSEHWAIEYGYENAKFPIVPTIMLELFTKINICVEDRVEINNSPTMDLNEFFRVMIILKYWI